MNKFHRMLLALIAAVFVLFPSSVFSQDDGQEEDDPRAELRERYKDSRVGPIVEWLLDEDRKYFILPIISSGPDTGLLVGLAWYHTDIFGKDKRDMILGAITTQSGQNSFMFSWTEPGIPLKDGRIALSLFLSQNPNGGIRYFGDGNDTRYEDVACNYRSNSGGFGIGYIYEFTEHLTVYGGYRWSESEFHDPDDDFEFGDEDDEANRPISLVHPDVYNSEPFDEGYTAAKISGSINYDSRSRDRLLRHGPGYRMSFGGSWADQDFGGDYDWAEWDAGFRHYIGIDKAAKHIIAYRGHYTRAWGVIPFNELPGLSSGTNRGYYSGRFRGDNKMEANLEYRWYITRHIGIAVFADTAKVYDNGGDHDDLFTRGWHPAYGGGLRFKIPPEIIFRIDYGISEEQSNVYFTIGESF